MFSKYKKSDNSSEDEKNKTIEQQAKKIKSLNSQISVFKKQLGISSEIGRPRKIKKEEYSEIQKLHSEGRSFANIASDWGVTENTIRKIINYKKKMTNLKGNITSLEKRIKQKTALRKKIIFLILVLLLAMFFGFFCFYCQKAFALYGRTYLPNGQKAYKNIATGQVIVPCECKCD